MIDFGLTRVERQPWTTNGVRWLDFGCDCAALHYAASGFVLKTYGCARHGRPVPIMDQYAAAGLIAQPSTREVQA